MYLNLLPREIICIIYNFFNKKEIHTISQINRFFRSIYWNDITIILPIFNDQQMIHYIHLWENRKLPQKLQISIKYPLTNRDIIHFLERDSRIYSIHFENFNEYIHFSENSNIRKLYFFLNFNQKIISWPPFLETLTIIGTYNQPFHYFPSQLKYIMIISTSFNQLIDDLPDTVNTIIIHSNTFNQKINKLPRCIKELYIKSNIFTQSFY
jgi:hypothetical protein